MLAPYWDFCTKTLVCSDAEDADAAAIVEEGLGELDSAFRCGTGVLTLMQRCHYAEAGIALMIDKEIYLPAIEAKITYRRVLDYTKNFVEGPFVRIERFVAVEDRPNVYEVVLDYF